MWNTIKPSELISLEVAMVRRETAIAAIFPGMSGTHTACSALHFEPVKEVEWHMVCHEKRKEDILISLI